MKLDDGTWIRGVNLGGWLVLERYITPYQFALTTCHVRGDLCWYPGQVSAPPGAPPLCDLYRCHPYRVPNVYGELDYPTDEYSLAEAFLQNEDSDDSESSSYGRQHAEDWFNAHFEHFVTKNDVEILAAAGVTHIRVPLPHWILGNLQTEEPWWIIGNRWKMFVRLCRWAREIGNLKVWPDIHTAPGSQNGFDNSGRQGLDLTCNGWIEDKRHVQRSLQVLSDISTAIVKHNLTDVVTGIGLLNEPFKDCDPVKYRRFLRDGLDIVQKILGQNVSVMVSDLFSAKDFNDGQWWLDETKYHHTYLDSHYYQVFAENTRALSPRQHAAYACLTEYKSNVQQSGTASCCYEDGPDVNSRVSRGVQRLVGEWSVAADILPEAMLSAVMDSIAANGTALHWDRVLEPARQDFLYHFFQTQVIAYEAADIAGISAGWMFWTAKTEGGAFAEWDFMRGLREGWIPSPLPNRKTSWTQHYGKSCAQALFDTVDDETLLQPFPPGHNENNWQGIPIDDDVVLSHGELLVPQLVPVTKNDTSSPSFVFNTTNTTNLSATENQQQLEAPTPAPQQSRTEPLPPVLPNSVASPTVNATKTIATTTTMERPQHGTLELLGWVLIAITVATLIIGFFWRFCLQRFVSGGNDRKLRQEYTPIPESGSGDEHEMTV